MIDYSKVVFEGSEWRCRAVASDLGARFPDIYFSVSRYNSRPGNKRPTWNWYTKASTDDISIIEQCKSIVNDSNYW